MDSPRGRIYLMEGLTDGRSRLNPTVIEHFDRCLGCMACVTSCPSGVAYDRLIETDGATIERRSSARAAAALRRLSFAILTHRAGCGRRRSRSLRWHPALPPLSDCSRSATLAPPCAASAARADNGWR